MTEPPPRPPLLDRVAEYVASLTLDRIPPSARERLPAILLDGFGCAYAGRAAGAHQSLRAGTGAPPGEATLWTDGRRVSAADAALLNGLLAHHVELDDGNPRASLHGAVTILPAALACAELIDATGAEFLAAVAAGYGAAVACGRTLLDGIGAHRLHPPAIVGCFGAAAAAARVLRLDAARTRDALGTVALLLPAAPFESFTKGAPVKDLYAGWPAYAGVTAARLAGHGLAAPIRAFEAPTDGLGAFYAHEPVGDDAEPDPDELLHVQFKAYATCRSVQPALTALEPLLPLAPPEIERILVETYPFACELSRDSDPSTPIGAKTSIPYCIAAYILDGSVGPGAFRGAALGEPVRQALAGRVAVEIAADMVAPVVRGARVTVTLRSGGERRAEVRETRWTSGQPATGAELLEKFRSLAGPAAPGIEAAVAALATAPDVRALSAALSRSGR